MASTTIDSPIGPLELSASDGRLTGIAFVGHWTLADPPAPIAAGTGSTDTGSDQAASANPADQRAADPVLAEFPALAETPVLAETRRQLAEYFAGTRTTFDLPLDPQGDRFHRDVWRLIAEIPYGETVTYGSIATRLGGIRLSQAVGSATGRNPLPLVVPCHRVIGADGTLTGFGGGLDRKRFLLALEESDEVKAARLF